MRNKWTKPFLFPGLLPEKFPDHRAGTGNPARYNLAISLSWKDRVESLGRPSSVEFQDKALKRRELHRMIIREVCREYLRVSGWIPISTCKQPAQGQENHLARIRANRPQRSHQARNSSYSYQPEWKKPHNSWTLWIQGRGPWRVLPQ